MAAKANILIDQGTDFSTTLTVTGDDGSVIDLTGYSANGHIRKHYTSTTATVFTCTFGSPRTDGQLTISLSRDITDVLEAGRYVYDVELTSSANNRSRLVEGVVTVTPQVTKA
jgi:hypothetical protein